MDAMNLKTNIKITRTMTDGDLYSLMVYHCCMWESYLF